MLKAFLSIIIISVTMFFQACNYTEIKQVEDQPSESISTMPIIKDIDKGNNGVQITTKNSNKTDTNQSKDTVIENEVNTLDKALEFVANLYYNGSKQDLYGEEISEYVFVVRLAKDFGSGLLTNVDAYLIINGKIIDSLYDKNTGEINEDFWKNVNKQTKTQADDR